mmetsp:Transcript_99713/g.287892  ORF Transcript_99713/g.287892 Transcript_99713/m.287892 type:complete len:202 (-) Transcript_99713:258-863(-)
MRAHLHRAQRRRHRRRLGQVRALPRRERAQRVVRPGVRRDAQGRRDPVGGRCGLLVALGICCAAAEPDRAEAVDGVGAHWRPSLRHTKWQGPRGWLRDRVDLPPGQRHGRPAHDGHRRHGRLRRLRSRDPLAWGSWDVGAHGCRHAGGDREEVRETTELLLIIHGLGDAPRRHARCAPCGARGVRRVPGAAVGPARRLRAH